MANTLPSVPPDWIEITCIGSKDREYIVGMKGPELFISGRNQGYKEMLHDGDWFLDRADRDASRATIGFIVVFALIVGLIGIAVWII